MANIDDDEIVCTGERVKCGKPDLKRKRDENGEKGLAKDGKCPEKKLAKISAEFEEFSDSFTFAERVLETFEKHPKEKEILVNRLRITRKCRFEDKDFKYCVCNEDGELSCYGTLHKDECRKDCVSHKCADCFKEGKITKEDLMSCGCCSISYCLKHLKAIGVYNPYTFQCPTCDDLIIYDDVEDDDDDEDNEEDDEEEEDDL
jgi:hypothetical protein